MKEVKGALASDLDFACETIQKIHSITDDWTLDSVALSNINKLCEKFLQSPAYAAYVADKMSKALMPMLTMELFVPFKEEKK